MNFWGMNAARHQVSGVKCYRKKREIKNDDASRVIFHRADINAASFRPTTSLSMRHWPILSEISLIHFHLAHAEQKLLSPLQFLPAPNRQHLFLQLLCAKEKGRSGER